MSGKERFEKEALGGLRISGRAEKEIERLADAASTARDRYTHSCLTLMEVSSTRQESCVALT